MEDALLYINPNLRHTAAPDGECRPYRGLKPLRGNNISTDIMENFGIAPLDVNEDDLINVVTLRLKQLDYTLVKTVGNLQGLEYRFPLADPALLAGLDPVVQGLCHAREHLEE